MYVARSWEADVLLFADWKAMRSTLSDCYHPGRFILLPSRSRSHNREEKGKASDMGGAGLLTIIVQTITFPIVHSVLSPFLVLLVINWPLYKYPHAQEDEKLPYFLSLTLRTR
jgi:hypothetical protein